MALEFKPGTDIRVTISRNITRASALKTLERLFMRDRAVARPIEARSRNFIPLPKRRGGQIWTKRPNKVFPKMITGAAATLVATPQVLRDLASVERFVEVKGG